MIKAFCLKTFKNAFRQAISVVIMFYFLAFLIGMMFLIVEEQFSLSEIFSPYSHSDKVFLAHVNLGIHFVVVILLSLFIPIVESFLSKISQPEKEDIGIKLMKIPSEILDDPLITMDLISKEENFLVRHMLQYHENLRSEKSFRRAPTMQYVLHKNLSKNFQIIRDIYRDLLNRSSYHRDISEKILEGIERQNLLMSLESNVYEFNRVTDQLRISCSNNKELAMRVLRFVEALDLLLLGLIDMMKNPESQNRQMIDILTTERKNFQEMMRSLFDSGLILEQADLIKEVHLFESSAWIIKKLAKLYLNRAKREKTWTDFLANRTKNPHRLLRGEEGIWKENSKQS